MKTLLAIALFASVDAAKMKVSCLNEAPATFGMSIKQNSIGISNIKELLSDRITSEHRLMSIKVCKNRLDTV